MHVQPGSRERRGPLTVAEHARARRAACAGTLTATRTDNLARVVVDDRLAALRAFEEQGYVHVGERAWLEEVVTGDQDLRYADWVRRTLDGLGLRWEVDDTPDGQTVGGAWATGLQVWHAEIDARPLRLEHPNLAHPHVEPVDDEFEVRVAGTAEGPLPSHLVTAFEAMHDLEYTFATRELPDGDGPDFPAGVEATNAVDPGRWALWVISEYGSGYPVHFHLVR